MPVPHRDATVLAPGSAFSGRVSGQELDVLGAFDGELELSGRVRLAAGSKVKARVRADLVEIEGDFEGDSSGSRVDEVIPAQPAPEPVAAF
jgi:cytoskeletal protein CcmA (bactofilin family)